MLRRMLLILVCAFVLVSSGARCVAQDTPDQASPQGTIDPETKAKVQAKLQEMATELNLNEEQKGQIKTVLQEEFTQLKAVSDDTSLSPDQMKAKATEIHESAKSQINSFLTPEQQKKLAKMREGAKENFNK